jgi:hypothetical protein
MPARSLRLLRAALLVGLLPLGTALARNPNEKEIKPRPNVEDKDESHDREGSPKAGSKLWVLDFKIRPLRSIKVNVPGRGEQVCYYLWYQVVNRTAEPHTFVPDFELVTQDTHMTYRDEILPTVQEAIAQLEDPDNLLKIKNSVEISREPIPPSLPNALPRAVTGVAIWTDPNEPLPRDSEEIKKEKAGRPKMTDSNYFSIFVAGLSNGWSETEAVGGGEPEVRRKTLQLKFRRFGDGALRRDEDIRYIDYQWLYRSSPLTLPKEEEEKKGGKPEKAPGPASPQPGKQ